MVTIRERRAPFCVMLFITVRSCIEQYCFQRVTRQHATVLLVLIFDIVYVEAETLEDTTSILRIVSASALGACSWSGQPPGNPLFALDHGSRLPVRFVGAGPPAE